MPKLIDTPHVTPKRIKASQFARNGLAPSAAFDSLLATHINHLVRDKRKMFFSHGIQLSQVPAGSAGATARCRFRFFTGLGAEGIRIRAAIMNRSAAATTSPYLRLALKDVVAATTATTDVTVSSTSSSGTGLNNLMYVDQVIACDELKVYELTVSDGDGTRLVSITGSDVAAVPSDDETCYLAAVSSVGKPITATRHNQIRDIINNLYAYNGPHLISWSTHSGVETVSSSGTTVVRALPTSSEFTLPLAKMARRNKTTVSVVFGAVADLGVSGTLAVHLYQAGSSVGSVTLTADDVWVTTTLNLSASDLAYDIRLQGSSVVNHVLKGVTCYVYDP